MNKRNTIEMLEKMAQISWEQLSGGQPCSASTMNSTRSGCALGFCLAIAEHGCQSWDMSALREALREIETACRWALGEQQAAFDDAIMQDPAGMARFLGMPETASPEEIMAEFTRRQSAATRGALDGDHGKEPA